MYETNGFQKLVNTSAESEYKWRCVRVSGGRCVGQLVYIYIQDCNVISAIYVG